MADSEVQDISPAVITAPAQADPLANSYSMSREGRRQAIILLLGVVSIWVFALWSLVTILDGGITGVEWVTSLLMLGILVVAPVVAWVLLEEVNSRFTVDDSGLRYTTLGGIDLKYAWADLTGLSTAGQRSKLAKFFLGDEDKDTNYRPKYGRAVLAAGEDDDEEEPQTISLAARKDHSHQIKNPAVRFLHKQAHGNALPIYGGLQNRARLLEEISARLLQA